MSLTRAQAEALFGRCVVDATSIEGAVPLERSHPREWRQMLRSWLPYEVRWNVLLTVGTLLRSGVVHDLVPSAKTSGAKALKRPRAAARLAVEFFTETRVVDVTDDRLNDFDHWLMRTPRPKTGRPCTRSTRRKYVQGTRKWIRQAQEHIGLEPEDRVSDKMPGRFRRWEERPLVKPWRIERLLDGVADVEAGAAFALAAGCGLLEAEMKRIGVADVVVEGGRILIWVRRGRKWRRVCVPAWAEDRVRALMRAVRGAHLFPELARGRSHRGTLRKLTRETGVLTFHDLRRFYQQFARASGVASGLLRGSLVFDSQAVWAESVGSRFAWARGVAALWTKVESPPGREMVPVPRRPLPGQCAYDPERDGLTAEELERLAVRLSGEAPVDVVRPEVRPAERSVERVTSPRRAPVTRPQAPAKSRASRPASQRPQTEQAPQARGDETKPAASGPGFELAPQSAAPASAQDAFPVPRAGSGPARTVQERPVRSEPPFGSLLLDFLVPKKSGGGR